MTVLRGFGGQEVLAQLGVAEEVVQAGQDGEVLGDGGSNEEEKQLGVTGAVLE